MIIKILLSIAAILEGILLVHDLITKGGESK